MAKLQNGEEILPKASTLSRAHKRYRQQMDLQQQIPEHNVVTFRWKSRSKREAMEMEQRDWPQKGWVRFALHEMRLPQASLAGYVPAPHVVIVLSIQ